MEKLPDRRSLKDHGPYSGYCHVCWNAVYILWIDDQPPAGLCMFGHKCAQDCPEAMNRARDAAMFAKLKREGRQKGRLAVKATNGAD